MITINGGKHKVSHLTKGQRLRMLLEKHERPVTWLAKKLGVSNTLVHKWLDNKLDLKLKWIIKINHVFNMDKDYWD